MVKRWWRLLLPSGLLLVVVVLVRRTAQLRDEVIRVVPSPDPWAPITDPLEPPAPQAP